MVYLDLDDKIIEQYITKDDILKVIDKALELNNIVDKNIYLTISAVNRDEIRKINKEYRNIDKETDVLSFPIFSKEEFKDIKFKELEIGDIIICLDIVSLQAIEYETGYRRELLYMITHGMCHLLGFDHEIEDDKMEMRSLEEKILSSLEV